MFTRRLSCVDSSALATPTPSSFARTSHVVEDKGPSARVLFDFSPTSPFELAASGTSPGHSDGVFMSARLTITYFLAESIVHVLEEDDGSGWVKVADDSGAKGLVPASYLEFQDAASAPDSRASTPGPRAAQSADDCGMYSCIISFQLLTTSTVRGIYPYKAQGPDELDVEEGAMIRLTDGPTGGRNYADGWWEGTRVCWPYPTYSEADGPLDPGFRGGREWEERHLPQQLRKAVIYTFSGRSYSLVRCRWRPHRFALRLRRRPTSGRRGVDIATLSIGGRYRQSGIRILGRADALRARSDRDGGLPRAAEFHLRILPFT